MKNQIKCSRIIEFMKNKDFENGLILYEIKSKSEMASVLTFLNTIHVAASRDVCYVWKDSHFIFSKIKVHLKELLEIDTSSCINFTLDWKKGFIDLELNSSQEYNNILEAFINKYFKILPKQRECKKILAKINESNSNMLIFGSVFKIKPNRHDNTHINVYQLSNKEELKFAVEKFNRVRLLTNGELIYAWEAKLELHLNVLEALNTEININTANFIALLIDRRLGFVDLYLNNFLNFREILERFLIN